jgi:hypothetical protein
LNRILYKHLRSPALETDEDRDFYGGVYHYPGPHKESNYGFFKERDLGIAPHVPAMLERGPRAVFGHFSFGLHRFLDEPAIYVTFLRNPVDRVISLYRQLEPEMSLEEFVDDYRVEGFEPDQTRLITDNDQTRRIAGEEPPFGRCDEALLARAKHNLETHFAAVCVTDRFDEGVVAMMLALGWEDVVPYWPRHIDGGRASSAPTDARTVDRILERNALDLELYRFARELFARQVERLGGAFQEKLEAYRRTQESVFRQAAEEDPEASEEALRVLRRIEREAAAVVSVRRAKPA